MSSTELKPIVLYDIPCITPGRPWSPNTMKARYCLGYKRLPFTTVWIEFPDITGLIQSKGITNPPYTLPAIEDPNTGAFVVESLAIATYLDATYPATPQVLPPAARRALASDMLGDAFSFGSGGDALKDPSITPRLVFLVLASDRLNQLSKAYYRGTRAERLGTQWTAIADACSRGAEERAKRVGEGVEAIRGVWHRVTRLYDRAPEHSSEREASDNAALAAAGSGPFVLGAEPCFLDFAVAGRIRFVLDGLTPSEAEALRNSEGNKLFELVENLEKYDEY